MCAQPRDDIDPSLVRLARGVIGKAVVADLDRTLCRMHKDPDLEVGGAVAQLFAVSMEVIVRFQDYQRWPFKAFTLCAKFSPDGY